MSDITMAGERVQPKLSTTWRQPVQAGILLAILCSGLLLWVLWGATPNHDVAWYLVAVREWLGGARLYVDIYEVNPPLNFYLTVPAILLADLTGMSDANALSATICLWIFLSLCAS